MAKALLSTNQIAFEISEYRPLVPHPRFYDLRSFLMADYYQFQIAWRINSSTGCTLERIFIYNHAMGGMYQNQILSTICIMPTTSLTCSMKPIISKLSGSNPLGKLPKLLTCIYG